MPVQTTYLDRAGLGYAGEIADGGAAEVAPAFNTEAATSIPFGFAVARDNTAPYGVSGNGAKLPASAGDVIYGLVRMSHAYSNSVNGDLDAVGLKPGAVMNVVRKGRIWAICEDGCAPGARLFVRYTAAGAGKGTCRATDAGGSTCLDVTTKGEWQTTASALGLAILDLDCVSK